MIKKKKLFLRPKKPFETERIQEENALVKKYGLKNKREVWKTLAKVNYYRRRAKELASASQEEQEVLFNKLKNIGLQADSIADVLGLKIEDLLERRLPTIVTSKGLADTAKQARQMVVHKKILVNKRTVNSPSYIVKVEEEDKITQKESKAKLTVKKEEAPQQEAQAETPEPKAEASKETPKPETPVQTEAPEKAQPPVQTPEQTQAQPQEVTA